MQKVEDKNRLTLWSVIQIAIAYYTYKFGVWLTKLSYSLVIFLFVIGMLSGTNNDLMNIYFPLALFIIAQIFKIIGATWALSKGVDLANLVLLNITKILHKDN